MSRDHLYSLLNCMVRVSTHSGVQEGYLVSVDPVSLTIVLYDEPKQSLSMIFHHAIKTVDKCDHQADESQQQRNFDIRELCANFFGDSTMPPQTYTAEELAKRREQVLQLLHSNNVPVEEETDLLVAAYSVAINAPYTAADCQSTNALVLNRIQKLLSETNQIGD